MIFACIREQLFYSAKSNDSVYRQCFFVESGQREALHNCSSGWMEM